CLQAAVRACPCLTGEVEHPFTLRQRPGRLIRLRLLQHFPRPVAIGDARRQRRLDADTRASTRCAASVDPGQRAADGNAARIELDEAAAGLEGQFDTGFDDYFLPGLEVDLTTGPGQLCTAQLDVLIDGYGQVVLRLDFHLALASHGQVFLCTKLAVAVGLDGVMTLVADADLLIVLDVLVPVSLGMNINLLGALPVLDAQLVVALAAGAAEGLEDAAGLVRRQFVGRNMFGVIQAAGDQRLVRIAFEKGDQHFHTDARNGDAAITVAGPAARYAQPATALVVQQAFAIPIKLDFHTTIFIAVDFFAGWAGHYGGLAAEHLGFRILEWRAIRYVPGGGGEMVAVALGECCPLSHKGRGSLNVRAWRKSDRLFQHLRLLAFMDDLVEQPEVVPFPTRVFGDFQEMTSDQVGLVTAAIGESVVA